MGKGYYGPIRDTILQLRETGPILVTDNGDCKYMTQLRDIRFYYHCEECNQEHAVPVHLLPRLLNDYTGTMLNEYNAPCPVVDEIVEFSEFEEV